MKRMTKKQKQQARRATFIAGGLMLGTLMLSARVAHASEPLVCGTDVLGSPIACKAGETPPTTVLRAPLPVPSSWLPPPVEGNPDPMAGAMPTYAAHEPNGDKVGVPNGDYRGGTTVPTASSTSITAPASTTATTDICGDYGNKEQCAKVVHAKFGPPATTRPSVKKSRRKAQAVVMAEGCRNEHYDDGTSEVICDTDGALPAVVPDVDVHDLLVLDILAIGATL